MAAAVLHAIPHVETGHEGTDFRETLTALHAMARQQIQILEGQNEILDLLRKKVAG